MLTQRIAIVVLTGFLAISAPYASAVTVPGTADPWLAGMPDGSQASNGDTAPQHSPTRAATVRAGDVLTFRARGWVSYAGGASGPSPDGGISTFTHSAGAENGISGLTAPRDSLVGVFLGKRRPDLGEAPAALTFDQARAGKFNRLSPRNRQVFFIGDGRNAAGRLQRFVAPNGASRLFLGTMDAYGWYNNSGAFEVTVRERPRLASAATVAPVPLPPAALLLLAATGAIAALSRRSRRAAR